jgi:hypothetical protein
MTYDGATDGKHARFNSPLWIGYVFAWVISSIAYMSAIFAVTAHYEYHLTHDLSFGRAMLGIGIAIIGHGAGAFILGTLLKNRLSSVIATAVYISPYVLLRVGVFLGAIYIPEIQEDVLSHPGNMILMPLIYLLIIPFVSYGFIRTGENVADEFRRPRSVLNIAWYHWLWGTPMLVFQVIGVPAFLLLLLWRIDLLIYEPISLFQLPDIIIRMMVFGVLALAIAIIVWIYRALTESYLPVLARIGIILGGWLALTAFQLLIVLTALGRNPA